MFVEPSVIGDLLEKMATVCFVAYLLTRTKGALNFIKNERSWQYIIVISLIFGFLYAFGYFSGAGTQTDYLSIKKIGPNMAGLLAGPGGGIGAAGVGLLLQGLGSEPVPLDTILTELMDGAICGVVFLLNNRRLIKVWQAGALGLVLTIVDTLIQWSFTPKIPLPALLLLNVVIIEVLVIAMGMALFTFLIHNVTRERERNITASCLEGQVLAAREMQLGYLPAPLEREGITIASCLIPMYEVGGDFYDFKQISESKLYFCIGDVAGKGVSAAFIMASTLTLLRNALIYSSEPDEILSQVNQGLVRSSNEGLFVTLFIGVMDLHTGEIVFANAGHVPPILITAQSSDLIQTEPDIPVGTWEDFSYHQERVCLKPGEQLVLYTDGVTECENAEGMLGIEPVLQKLRREQPSDPESVAETITGMVFDYAGTGVPNDDVTVLVIRRDTEGKYPGL